jgi:NAD(P)-dependent dehydrogenase (short-subunit alcohol dehydrogenase family)
MLDLPSPTKTFHKRTYPSLDPTRPELSAKGKVIVITGGGTGIGAETAKYFAKAGAARIAILGRRQQPLLDTKTVIESEYPSCQVLAIPTDVVNNVQVKDAFAQAAGDGKINVLVSNAAVLGVQGNIATLSVEKWMEGIVINLQGNFNVTKAFLEYAAKDSVIIETNSAAAHITVAPRFSVYNVSKAATARFYDSLAFENPKLSVFSVQPGAVDTDMSKESGYKPKSETDGEWAFKGEGGDVLGERDEANLPASFYVWLASPEAHFLRGKYLWANWDVDELKARAEEIEKTNFLSLGLIGWPFDAS